MGRQYAINGDQNIASPAATALTLGSTTAIRPRIYYFAFGTEDTPADATIVWYAQRCTALGTSTAVTPSPIDPGDPAATGVAGKNHTVEPTYTASIYLYRAAVNQRTFTQVYLDRAPLVLPATNSNGVGWYPNHATSTVNTSVVAHYEE
jgi:hypothetical protein